MKYERLSNALQIFANLGIVAGLLLVAFQINQTEVLTYKELLTRSFEMNKDQQISMFGEQASEAWLKGFVSPDSLTTEELGVIFYILDHRADIHSFESRLLSDGEEISEAWAAILRWHAINTYGANNVTKIWWSQSDYFSDSAWGKYVDGVIQNGGYTADIERFYYAYCAAFPQSSTCEDRSSLDSSTD